MDHFDWFLSCRKSLKGTWDFGSLTSENGSMVISAAGNNSGSNTSSTTTTMHATTGADCGRATANGRASVSVHAHGQTNNKQTACSQQVRSVASSVSVDQMSGTVGSSSSSLQRSVTRALWAGVKATEGNHYTITHVQPFEQRRPLPAPLGYTADEDSAGYTTLHPNATMTMTTAAAAAAASSSALATTDNQIYYYCSTDIMVGLPLNEFVPKVTSLDDPPAGNPLYVNMSSLNPIASNKSSRMQMNPLIYATSDFRPQHLLRSSAHVHPPRFAQSIS